MNNNSKVYSSIFGKFLAGLAILMTLFSMRSFARGFDSINTRQPADFKTKEIDLNGLDYYRGLMLTAFYVSGRQAGFGTVGSIPRIRRILRTAGPFEIRGNGDHIQIPSLSVKPVGIAQYNYIIFVVHSPYLDEVALRNLDGTIPVGQEGIDFTKTGDSSPFNHRDIFFMPKDSVGSGSEKGIARITLRPRIIR